MKHSIACILLVFTFSNCQHQTEKQTKTSSPEHPDEVPAVQLSNGEKWEANLETTEGIKTMTSRIESFKQEGSSNYTVLQANLQADFKMIFQKCTMKGEAHDQLHNYLLPLKKELDQLSAANLDSVSTYLQTYNKYFQ